MRSYILGCRCVVGIRERGVQAKEPYTVSERMIIWRPAGDVSGASRHAGRVLAAAGTDAIGCFQLRDADTITLRSRRTSTVADAKYQAQAGAATLLLAELSTVAVGVLLAD